MLKHDNGVRTTEQTSAPDLLYTISAANDILMPAVKDNIKDAETRRIDSIEKEISDSRTDEDTPCNIQQKGEIKVAVSYYDNTQELTVEREVKVPVESADESEINHSNLTKNGVVQAYTELQEHAFGKSKTDISVRPIQDDVGIPRIKTDISDTCPLLLKEEVDNPFDGASSNELLVCNYEVNHPGILNPTITNTLDLSEISSSECKDGLNLSDSIETIQKTEENNLNFNVSCFAPIVADQIVTSELTFQDTFSDPKILDAARGDAEKDDVTIISLVEEGDRDTTQVLCTSEPILESFQLIRAVNIQYDTVSEGFEARKLENQVQPARRSVNRREDFRKVVIIDGEKLDFENSDAIDTQPITEAVTENIIVLKHKKVIRKVVLKENQEIAIEEIVEEPDEMFGPISLSSGSIPSRSNSPIPSFFPEQEQETEEVGLENKATKDEIKDEYSGELFIWSKPFIADNKKLQDVHKDENKSFSPVVPSPNFNETSDEIFFDAITQSGIIKMEESTTLSEQKYSAFPDSSNSVEIPKVLSAIATSKDEKAPCLVKKEEYMKISPNTSTPGFSIFLDDSVSCKTGLVTASEENNKVVKLEKEIMKESNKDCLDDKEYFTTDSSSSKLNEEIHPQKRQNEYDLEDITSSSLFTIDKSSTELNKNKVVVNLQNEPKINDKSYATATTKQFDIERPMMEVESHLQDKTVHYLEEPFKGDPNSTKEHKSFCVLSEEVASGAKEKPGNESLKKSLLPPGILEEPLSQTICNIPDNTWDKQASIIGFSDVKLKSLPLDLSLDSWPQNACNLCSVEYLATVLGFTPFKREISCGFHESIQEMKTESLLNLIGPEVVSDLEIKTQIQKSISSFMQENFKFKHEETTTKAMSMPSIKISIEDIPAPQLRMREQDESLFFQDKWQHFYNFGLDSWPQGINDFELLENTFLRTIQNSLITSSPNNADTDMKQERFIDTTTHLSETLNASQETSKASVCLQPASLVFKPEGDLKVEQRQPSNKSTYLEMSFELSAPFSEEVSIKNWTDTSSTCVQELNQHLPHQPKMCAELQHLCNLAEDSWPQQLSRFQMLDIFFVQSTSLSNSSYAIGLPNRNVDKSFEEGRNEQTVSAENQASDYDLLHDFFEKLTCLQENSGVLKTFGYSESDQQLELSEPGKVGKIELEQDISDDRLSSVLEASISVNQTESMDHAINNLKTLTTSTEKNELSGVSKLVSLEAELMGNSIDECVGTLQSCNVSENTYEKSQQEPLIETQQIPGSLHDYITDDFTVQSNEALTKYSLSPSTSKFPSAEFITAKAINTESSAIVCSLDTDQAIIFPSEDASSEACSGSEREVPTDCTTNWPLYYDDNEIVTSSHSCTKKEEESYVQKYLFDHERILMLDSWPICGSQYQDSEAEAAKYGSLTTLYNEKALIPKDYKQIRLPGTTETYFSEEVTDITNLNSKIHEESGAERMDICPINKTLVDTFQAKGSEVVTSYPFNTNETVKMLSQDFCFKVTSDLQFTESLDVSSLPLSEKHKEQLPSSYGGNSGQHNLKEQGGAKGHQENILRPLLDLFLDSMPLSGYSVPVDGFYNLAMSFQLTKDKPKEIISFLTAADTDKSSSKESPIDFFSFEIKQNRASDAGQSSPVLFEVTETHNRTEDLCKNPGDSLTPKDKEFDWKEEKSKALLSVAIVGEKNESASLFSEENLTEKRANADDPTLMTVSSTPYCLTLNESCKTEQNSSYVIDTIRNNESAQVKPSKLYVEIVKDSISINNFPLKSNEVSIPGSIPMPKETASMSSDHSSKPDTNSVQDSLRAQKLEILRQYQACNETVKVDVSELKRTDEVTPSKQEVDSSKASYLKNELRFVCKGPDELVTEFASPLSPFIKSESEGEAVQSIPIQENLDNLNKCSSDSKEEELAKYKTSFEGHEIHAAPCVEGIPIYSDLSEHNSFHETNQLKTVIEHCEETSVLIEESRGNIGIMGVKENEINKPAKKENDSLSSPLPLVQFSRFLLPADKDSKDSIIQQVSMENRENTSKDTPSQSKRKEDYGFGHLMTKIDLLNLGEATLSAANDKILNQPGISAPEDSTTRYKIQICCLNLNETRPKEVEFKPVQETDTESIEEETTRKSKDSQVVKLEENMFNSSKMEFAMPSGQTDACTDTVSETRQVIILRKLQGDDTLNPEVSTSFFAPDSQLKRGLKRKSVEDDLEYESDKLPVSSKTGIKYKTKTNQEWNLGNEPPDFSVVSALENEFEWDSKLTPEEKSLIPSITEIVGPLSEVSANPSDETTNQDEDDRSIPSMQQLMPAKDDFVVVDTERGDFTLQPINAEVLVLNFGNENNISPQSPAILDDTLSEKTDSVQKSQDITDIFTDSSVDILKVTTNSKAVEQQEGFESYGLTVFQQTIDIDPISTSEIAPRSGMNNIVTIEEFSPEQCSEKTLGLTAIEKDTNNRAMKRKHNSGDFSDPFTLENVESDLTENSDISEIIIDSDLPLIGQNINGSDQFTVSQPGCSPQTQSIDFTQAKFSPPSSSTSSSPEKSPINLTRDSTTEPVDSSFFCGEENFGDSNVKNQAIMVAEASSWIGPYLEITENAKKDLDENFRILTNKETEIPCEPEGLIGVSNMFEAALAPDKSNVSQFILAGNEIDSKTVENESVKRKIEETESIQPPILMEPSEVKLEYDEQLKPSYLERNKELCNHKDKKENDPQKGSPNPIIGIFSSSEAEMVASLIMKDEEHVKGIIPGYEVMAISDEFSPVSSINEQQTNKHLDTDEQKQRHSITSCTAGELSSDFFFPKQSISKYPETKLGGEISSENNQFNPRSNIDMKKSDNEETREKKLIHVEPEYMNQSSETTTPSGYEDDRTRARRVFSSNLDSGREVTSLLTKTDSIYDTSLGDNCLLKYPESNVGNLYDEVNKSNITDTCKHATSLSGFETIVTTEEFNDTEELLHFDEADCKEEQHMLLAPSVSDPQIKAVSDELKLSKQTQFEDDNKVLINVSLRDIDEQNVPDIENSAKEPAKEETDDMYRTEILILKVQDKSNSGITSPIVEPVEQGFDFEGKVLQANADDVSLSPIVTENVSRVVVDDSKDAGSKEKSVEQQSVSLSEKLRDLNSVIDLRCKAVHKPRTGIHRKSFCYLTAITQFFHKTSAEQRVAYVHDNIATLRNSIDLKETVVIERVIVEIVTTVTEWLETIEYKVYTIRQIATLEHRMKEIKSLKEEVRIVENSLEILEEVTEHCVDVVNDDIKYMIKSCVRRLQDQVKIVEDVALRSEEEILDLQKRWQDYLNSISTEERNIEQLNKQVILIENEVIETPVEKLDLLEDLELKNQAEMMTVDHLIEQGEGFVKEIPGYDIPIQVFSLQDTCRYMGTKIHNEREKVLQGNTAIEEYRIYLREFCEIMNLARSYYADEVGVEDTANLFVEIQKRIKFFTCFSHCSSVLNSIIALIDPPTRQHYLDQHANLTTDAEDVLDFGAGRIVSLRVAFDLWNNLNISFGEEDIWLDHIISSLPRLESLSSCNLESALQQYVVSVIYLCLTLPLFFTSFLFSSLSL